MAMINFCLDSVLFLSLVFVVWVTAMMQLVFPAPTIADGWRLWGWSFNQWRDAQFGAICVCAALAIEHLVLHWNWVCGIIATKILRSKNRPDEASQAVYGVGTFIFLLLVMLAGVIAATVCVQPPQ